MPDYGSANSANTADMTTLMATNQQETNNVTFIRTILALGVLVMHLFSSVGGVFFLTIPWVPAFITLSGFLITESMVRSRGFWHFIWKRIIRILPAFILSLVLVAILGGNVMDALFDWITLGFQPKGANSPLWTLGIEELLYLSIATAFSAGMYVNKHKALLCLFVCYILFFVVALLAPQQLITICRLAICFIIGSTVNLLRNNIYWSNVNAVACLILVIGMRHEMSPWSPYYQLLMPPILAYALIFFAFYARATFATYKIRVGDPSLGIYIYHWPIMIWLKNKGLSTPGYFAMTLCITLLCALASWHLVEKHCLKFRDWQFGKYSP